MLEEKNYDEKPIKIVDYNYLFLLMGILLIIPTFITIVIYNPASTPDTTLQVYLLILIPIFILPTYLKYFKIIGKRQVILKNNTIEFLHDSKVIESINLNEITSVYRTRCDYYHFSQRKGYDGLDILIGFVLLPIRLSGLIFLKFTFHLYMDGIKSYKFNDSILVFSEEKLINILPTTLAEYNEVRNYFIEKNNINLLEEDVYFDWKYSADHIDDELK